MSGPLYDDFRIANIKDGATQLVIQIDSPWENERYAVYSVDDFLINQYCLQTQVEN